jgi:dipeptide transport system substrate-binding protein
MRLPNHLTLAGASLAALLLSASALSAKTLVYCSEGSPENFSPSINTTGTSFDAARPFYSPARPRLPPTSPINGTCRRTVKS